MRFGDLPVGEADGAILAHTLKAGRLAFKKGRRLTAEDCAALAAAGIASVTAARLEPGDVPEDAAAARLGAALAGAHLDAAAPFTGRVNLFAAAHGLVVIDRARLDRINRIDEALTVATLPDYAVVEPGRMAATIKVIPFAAPAAALAEAEALAADSAPPLRVAPFRGRPAALIQTVLPGTRAGMLDKTARVTAERLAALGCPPAAERRCGHAAGPLAEAVAAALAGGAELLLIAGASAITDRRDVLPAAIAAAGGRVEHFGMPVDPGNLLLLGRVGAVPVVGLPGCARSPRLNGIDRVLERLAADLPVGRDEVMGMGVGGLLTETPARPQPRTEPDTAGDAAAGPPRAPRIAALVLAAGRSRRMGGPNKLLAEVAGMPMVARVADAALASRADPVVVVVGHEAGRVRAALAGRPVRLVDNPDFAAGLSTSLKAGLAALPDTADGALVLLGDMPQVTAAELDRLIAAHAPAEGRAVVVPTRRGRRGNPVLWDRRFFGEMRGLAGDTGARHLIGLYDDWVAEVEMGSDAVLTDVDTPEALARLAAPARGGPGG